MEEYLNKIIHGDCMDILQELPDGGVDLILTDPPYLVAAKGCGLAGNREYLEKITEKELDEGFNLDALYELDRVCRNTNLIIFCSKNQIRDYIDFAENNEYKWQMICWHKTNPTPLTNNNYLPDTEYIFHIWQNRKLTGDYKTKRKFYVQEVEKNNFKHPTVKPLNIVENLIINGSDVGDIVLDCFSGMATTAIGCHNLNRNFICIEKDEEYYEASIKRLEEHQRQGRLL